MTDKNKKEDKDDYELLVDECIKAYKELLNSSMALDLCHVQGKMRSIILHDERFVSETRAIKASQYLSEIKGINKIYDAATSLGGAIEDADVGSDGRDDAGSMSDKQVIQAKKDALAMQLKASEMRRELLSLSSENEGEEESAVNFFFTALTAEEMEKMKQVEINDGDEDESGAMKELKKEDSNDIASQTLKRKKQAEAMHGGNEEEEAKEETESLDGPLVFDESGE